jgi:ATP-dependent helicase/nuclease subunit B
MNRLVQALADICRERPLDEKWLVAPTLRIGHQWVEAVARSGRAVVNVDVTTLRRSALDLAAPVLAERGVRLASDLECEALVDSACRALASEDGYLLSGDADPGLARAVAAAVSALRAAGLSGGDLAPKRFEVERKGHEIAAVLEAYVGGLARHGLVDYADVCRMSAERVAADPSAFPEGLAILVPTDTEASPVEQALLDAVPAAAIIELPVDGPPAGLPDAGEPTDAALLRWIDSPADAPAPSGDGTASVFRAEGEVNEVREALRRCLAEGVPLDHVEFLHTDQETYVPLVYETLARMGYADAGGLGGLPATFAEGIPARYTRPGRALSAWAAWVRNGHPQSTLVRMLRAGLLSVPGGDGEVPGFRELASVLRAVAIGSGADRYLPRLDEAIESAERASLRRARGSTDDPEDEEARRENAKRRDLALRALRELVAGLLELAPASDPEADVLRAGREFLQRFVRSGGEIDSFARDRLVENIAEVLAVLDELEGALPSAAAGSWEWLAALPRSTRVGGSGPRPGCLHVAHVLSGGHSGRPRTFIVGVDDARFPGAGLQDPVLLDDERDRLARGALPTASGKLAERMRAFARTLARLRGRVTLSYSCRSIVDDREAFASPVLVSAYRILSGEPGGDQAGLEEWAGRPVSFAPAREDLALDEAEWWLWRGCAGERVENADDLVRELHKNLGFGAEAARRRADLEFTVYDGRVPEAGRELDPAAEGGSVVSASRLETVGRCPRAYFFRYALRIEPPDDLDADPEVWLDGLARGSLLHAVFREFMAELVAKGVDPSRARHEARLAEILDAHIMKLRDESPPPTEGVFMRECADLREAAAIFLAEEEEHCRKSRPAYLEASVGLPSDGEGTPIDTAEPVSVELPGGRSIRVRGRLDRIDRVSPADSEGSCEDELFAIWDYKTGSTFGYRDDDPFRQGRNVQHAVYLEIAEAVLRKKVSPSARVALFGYFFPGAKGQGERMTYTPSELARGREVITLLCDTVAGGAFAASDDSGDCRYCDYAPICGQTDPEAERSRRKLEHDGNAELAPFRRLRSDGEGGADG